MNAKTARRTLMFGSITTIVLALVGVAVVTAAGIAGWEYSTSNAFCATMCHDVHPEEIAAHKVGTHHRLKTSDVIAFREQRHAAERAIFHAGRDDEDAITFES